MRLLRLLPLVLARGARGAFARAGRRRAVEQDALRRRALGPLPDGRPVAVPARRGGPGGAPALLPPELDRGLVAGVGAERVERGGRLRGVDARLGRLVPEGLRAARQACRARVGGALRVGQLPLAGVPQRARDRPQRGRLHPVPDAPGGPAQARRQPARRPRRLAPAADRLPALGPEREGQRDRRLVQLRRDPARGLPAEARHGRVRHRARAAQAAVRSLPGDDRLHARAGERHGPRPADQRDRDLRRAPRPAGHAHGLPRPDRRVHRPPADPEAAPVVAEAPVPVPGEDHRLLGRAHRRHLLAQERRAVAEGLARAPLPQRPAGEHARRRRARGHPHAGLRGRQRVPRRSSSGRRGRSAPRCCARTTRCTPTSTSWPTRRGC